jgi:hypothetical protein
MREQLDLLNPLSRRSEWFGQWDCFECAASESEQNPREASADMETVGQNREVASSLISW